MSQPKETGYDQSALQKHAITLAKTTDAFSTEVQKKEVEMLFNMLEQLSKLGPQCTDQIAELRLLLRDVVQVGREAKAHETSLREVAQEIASSESSLKTQDYKQMLQTKREHVLNNQQYDWENSREARDFDEKASKVSAFEDSDEEVVVQANAQDIAPNHNCPCSLKPLMELEDPVEDEAGIVYDRAAIEGHIRSTMRTNRNNSVMCPLAGSTHEVSLNSLRTAAKVIRAQKRNQRREAERAEEGSDNDGVLDVD